MKQRSSLLQHISILAAALAAILTYATNSSAVLIYLLLSAISLNMLISILEDILIIKWEKKNGRDKKKS
jgi:UDP-N-acetylmuramyl pentapeptide phosphotransferase/UDP-N-acetylglucosamine-1-phosphate transferase